eukprot:scaffold7344_cov242-Pinguiococcus_pyrenoidosus.AAC.7
MGARFVERPTARKPTAVGHELDPAYLGLRRRPRHGAQVLGAVRGHLEDGRRLRAAKHELPAPQCIQLRCAVTKQGETARMRAVGLVEPCMGATEGETLFECKTGSGL